MPAEQPEVSIILPTYNERENLTQLVERLVGLNLNSEIIVVNDASPDGTAEVARKLAERHPLRLLERSGKLGLASAIIDGLNQARGNILTVMDADLSHDPNAVSQLVQTIRNGFDVAIGSRYVTGGGMVGWPLRRQWMSWLATRAGRTLFRLTERDTTSGVFALKRAVFDRIKDKLRPQGYKLLMEILVRGQPLKTREIGYIFQDRLYGKSKISWAIAWQYLAMMFALLTRKRLK